MELELKHITPYLPYGLKVQYIGVLNGKELSEYKKLEPKNNMKSKDEIDEYNKWLFSYPQTVEGLKISKIKGIKFYNNYITIHVGRSFSYSKTVFCGNIKPILRPLSDLTKEIEVNKEKFVPIEKLQSIFSKRIRFDEDGFYNHDLKSVVNIGGDKPFSFNQLEAYSYLFQWHFDVFDLHSKNLCIYFDELK